MDISQLGGIFKLIGSYEQLSEKLKTIYDQFTSDTCSKLKLDFHPEYYGPVISDYYRNRKTKYQTLLWITDPLTLRFYHKKNPNINLFEMALNLGDFELAAQQYPHSYNIIKNHIDVKQKIDVLLELKESMDKIFEKSVMSHDLSAIKYCVQKGFIINNRLTRVFNHVIENGYLDVIQYFEEYNIAINSYDYLSVIACIQNKQKHVFEYLYNKAKSYPIPNIYGITYEYFNNLIDNLITFLYEACATGNLDEVKYYINLGISINLYHRPAKKAVENNHLHIMQYLIESGLNLNLNLNPGYTHQSFLKLAVVNGLYEMCKLLIDNGATTEITLGEFENHQNFDILKLLLDKQMVIDYVGIFDMMCINRYFKEENLEYLRLYYNINANQIKSGFIDVIKSGYTANFDYLVNHFQFDEDTLQYGFLYSLTNTKTHILDYFIKKGYKIESLKTNKCVNITENCLEYLIEQKIDIKELQEPVLQGLVLNNKVKVLEMLIQQGIDIHCNFDNLIKRACILNNQNMIKCLLNAGLFKKSLLDYLLNTNCNFETNKLIQHLLTTKQYI